MPLVRHKYSRIISFSDNNRYARLMEGGREERVILTLIAIASASAFSIGLSQVFPTLATNPFTVSHNILFVKEAEISMQRESQK